MGYTPSTFWLSISYIVYDLGALGVTLKIQVMSSLQVVDLSTIISWI